MSLCCNLIIQILNVDSDDMFINLKRNSYYIARYIFKWPLIDSVVYDLGGFIPYASGVQSIPRGVLSILPCDKLG